MDPILSLPPDQFRAALAELQLDPQREAELVRQYRRANSVMSPLYGLLERISSGDAQEGMQRASLLPVTRPEGMSVVDAIGSGDARLAVPQGLLDILGGGAQAFDAPAAAAQGLISAEDMVGEALNLGGFTMGAGGAAAVPQGALRASALRSVDDYAGSHRAPGREYGASFDDPREMFGGDDIYTQRAANYFGHGDNEMDMEAIRAINAARSNPDAEVTIYRAVPSDLEGVEINPGDWVSPSRRYAQLHGEGPLGGDYQIVEQKVRAGDLFTDGDIHEWGYSPELSSNRSTAGGLLATAAETPAQRVARMLREGRADEVTDDLMAQADPQEMYRLYEAGETGADMPMDYESRMGRAIQMNFDVNDEMYRGDAPRQSFQTGQGQRDQIGVTMSSRPDVAASYIPARGEGGIYPLVSRGQSDATIDAQGRNWNVIDRDVVVDFQGDRSALRDYIPDSYFEPYDIMAGTDFVNTNDLSRAFQGYGADRVRFNDLVDRGGSARYYGPESSMPSDVMMVANPSNVRSRFARFDPRLSHLENLNAANVDPITGLAAMSASQQNDPLANLRAYIAAAGGVLGR